MRVVVFSAVAAALLLTPVRAQETKPATDVASYKPFADTAAKVKDLWLYEGFPHPVFEKKLLDQELSYRNRFRHQGFSFYQNRPKLKDKDIAALKKVLENSKSFVAWTGEKKCGGFHPDYMVQWKDGDDIYRVQICFGCSEIKAFGPKGAVRLDMATDTGKALQETLKRYNVFRPKAKKD